MIMFVAAVAALGVFLFPPLKSAFMANAPLNGLIVGVLLIGIGYNFRQVLVLYTEVDWIEDFRRDRLVGRLTPRLLASMATMLGDSSSTFRLSALSMRSVLDGIASRLDESRD
ncbi:MAG: flagellar motor protein MotA, partial [Alphaproteobacteria bacterium]|nr:flagellar motor protein MotA [Alphaproteobacteria bacterium]